MIITSGRLDSVIGGLQAHTRNIMSRVGVEPTLLPIREVKQNKSKVLGLRLFKQSMIYVRLGVQIRVVYRKRCCEMAIWWITVVK